MLYRQLCYCEIPDEKIVPSGVTHTVFESETVLHSRMSIDTYNLEQFLKDVEKRAYRMAYIATSNVDDALDIVQDAMITLASKYAEHKQEEWPPLFFRIVQNKIRDFYRKQKVRGIFSSFFGTDNEDDSHDPIQTIADDKIHDPVRKISGENNIKQLESALKTLPLRQQQTFLLRAWEGLDVKQTAEAMNITTGSVKTHYSRALKALRTHVGEVGYE